MCYDIKNIKYIILNIYFYRIVIYDIIYLFISKIK